MTRAELDAALRRLGLAVPEGERDEIAAAAHLVEDMVARLRPAAGQGVAAEPAHVVRFPKG
jgi:cell division protein ZapA (FtsZ GTPase activity inhibitor)